MYTLLRRQTLLLHFVFYFDSWFVTENGVFARTHSRLASPDEDTQVSLRIAILSVYYGSFYLHLAVVAKEQLTSIDQLDLVVLMFREKLFFRGGYYMKWISALLAVLMSHKGLQHTHLSRWFYLRLFYELFVNVFTCLCLLGPVFALRYWLRG